MVIRILNVLNEYGIKPSATKNTDFGYESRAVTILTAVGDGIGLVRSEHTWRDIIQKSK
jgi:hypothetical protein